MRIIEIFKKISEELFFIKAGITFIDKKQEKLYNKGEERRENDDEEIAGWR